MSAKRCIYGVGIGPGDAELITLKAFNRLRKADVVVYPAAENTPSLVRAIAYRYFPNKCHEICLEIPMQADLYTRKSVYQPYADEIIAQYKQGKRIVILCEGDPMFYGSFSYLYEILAKTCVVEIIPGVASLHAASALLGRSLARRSQILTVIPATLRKSEIVKGLQNCDNAVIIKLGRHLDKMREIIENKALQEKTLFVQHIGLENEQTCKLKEFKENQAPYFSMLLIYDIQSKNNETKS